MNDLEAARAALGAGALAVIPTDTVYGLAADPAIPGAVDGIFRVKQRSRSRPIPVLGADRRQLESVVVFDERADRLAERFWPGPLTLILPRAPGFVADLGGDGRSVAVRVPKEPRAIQLLKETGPLAVTSANRSGEPPVPTIDDARATFGNDVAVYLDGGRCAGIPSTLVFLAGERRVLREGKIPAREILEHMH